MRTQCGASGCGKEFASVESAEKHFIKKHEPIRRTVGGKVDGQFVKEWPATSKGYYLGGLSWGEFADLRS